MLSSYIIHLLIMISIYSVLTLGLNVTVGFSGLLNLGHIAFFGIGAYTSALLVKAGMPFFLSFFLAGIFASSFGYLLVFSVRKLKGDYLALATLAFNFVIYSLMINWTGLTRGPLGIPGITKPSFLGFSISSNYEYLIFAAAIALLSFLFLQHLTSSHYGKLLEAARDDELALSVLGKNTFTLKCQSMMIAAFFAGIAGSLYAHYITYIDPSSFSLTEIILVFTIIIVGGLASLKGTVIATFVIILIPEVLRFFYFPSSILGPARQIIYALVLIGILIYRPKGFYGKVELN